MISIYQSVLLLIEGTTFPFPFPYYYQWNLSPYKNLYSSEIWTHTIRVGSVVVVGITVVVHISEVRRRNDI